MLGNLGAMASGNVSGNAGVSADGSVSGGLSAGGSVNAGGVLDAALQGAAGLGGSLSASMSASLDASLDARFAASASLKSGGPGIGDHSPDPWLAFRVMVVIQGMKPLRFKDCSAIGVDGVPATAGAGGASSQRMLTPAKWQWKPITLGRGMATDGAELWAWLLDCLNTRVKPRPIVITFFTPTGEMGMEFTFQEAFPTNWAIQQFDASQPNSSILIEKFTFGYERLTLVVPGAGAYSGEANAPAPPSPTASPRTPQQSGGTQSAGGNPSAGGGRTPPATGGQTQPTTSGQTQPTTSGQTTSTTDEQGGT